MGAKKSSLAGGYHITKYSYKQAKRLNVTIRPSTVRGKKIDVFKNGRKIASIGAIGYGDYPTFYKRNPEYAKRRRVAYKKRHEKDRHRVGSPGYYADQILW